tara:strand:- start:1884 stop:2003 length:120 start_codon:yes stop_codon:yes gene_type:complete
MFDIIEQLLWYAEKYLVPVVLFITGIGIIIKFIIERSLL